MAFKLAAISCNNGQGKDSLKALALRLRVMRLILNIIFGGMIIVLAY